MKCIPQVSRSPVTGATMKWLRLAAAIAVLAPTLPVSPCGARVETTCSCASHGEADAASGGSCRRPAAAPSCHAGAPAERPAATTRPPAVDGASCHTVPSGVRDAVPSDGPSFAGGCGCHHGAGPIALSSVNYVVPRSLERHGIAPADEVIPGFARAASRASHPDVPPPRTLS